MTHAERLLWLAKREKDCPVGNGIGIDPPEAAHTEVCLCKGTGMVPRFPTLRRECTMRSEYQTCWQSDDNGEFLHKDGTRWTRRGCPNCQGRGWVPVDSLEATMEAISAPVAFDYTEQGWACNLWPRIGACGWTTQCETPNEAAVLALYEYEMARAGAKP